MLMNMPAMILPIKIFLSFVGAQGAAVNADQLTRFAQLLDLCPDRDRRTRQFPAEFLNADPALLLQHLKNSDLFLVQLFPLLLHPDVFQA